MNTKYYSTKTYGHETGLSVCFRQYRADSHCSKFHGYALSFKFTFQAEKLDSKGWVVDFGGLKSLLAGLREMYDHKMLVHPDDPIRDLLRVINTSGAADVRVTQRIGCEAFAETGYEIAEQVLLDMGYHHARVVSCEVSEHGGNSAIFKAQSDIF